MNRDLLETIRLLGLDAELALVLTLLATSWALRQIRRAAERRRGGTRPMGAASLRQSTATVSTTQVAWEK